MGRRAGALWCLWRLEFGGCFGQPVDGAGDLDDAPHVGAAIGQDQRVAIGERGEMCVLGHQRAKKVLFRILLEMSVEMPGQIARDSQARSIEKRFLHAEAISLLLPRLMAQLVPRPRSSLMGPLSAYKHGNAFVCRYSTSTNGLS
jgi:hypothetical protein